ncbi:hypothetical protein K8R30_01685 [archaeon]|nr:hypothetical protein [archaeon]
MKRVIIGSLFVFALCSFVFAGSETGMDFVVNSPPKEVVDYVPTESGVGLFGYSIIILIALVFIYFVFKIKKAKVGKRKVKRKKVSSKKKKK